MNELYDRRVLEMVVAVGNATSEKQTRERVQQRIDLACDHNFLPVLMHTREQLSQWREAPPDVDQVIALTLSVVHSTLLERSPTEIGLGGICTALIANNSREDLVRDTERFTSLLGDPFFDEWDAMTREFEARALDKFAASVRAQGDVIAFLALGPKLDQLMQSLKNVSSTREGIERIADTAQSTGRWIVRGCGTVEAMARGSDVAMGGSESDLILVKAILQARERFDAGGSREAIVEELLDDQNIKMFVRVQRARAVTTGSKEELTEVAARINPQFGASVRFVLSDRDEDARRVLEDEPGMFSRQAEREFDESANSFSRQGRTDLAERFQHAAARVRRWRDELIDPQQNILVRLGARVGARDLTLTQAIAELKQAGALAELTSLHLGALDERVINLRDAGDLQQAEILAVLNQAAAHALGAPKMIAYTDLSLGELWSARGESAEKTLSLLKEADEIAQEIGDARMQARALGTLGMLYHQTSRFQEALEAYHHAWAIGREADLADVEIASLDNLLGTYALIGDVKRAKEMANQALESARKTNDRDSEYKVLAQLATVLFKAGRADESIGYSEKALQIAREFGDGYLEANILSSLSQAYTSAKHYGTAEDYAHQALVLARDSGNLRLQGIALSSLGLIHYRRAEMHEALEFFQDALQSVQQAGSPDGQATMLNNIGRVEMALGKYAEAEQHYQASIEKMEQVRIGLVDENERIAFMGFDRVHPYTGLVKLFVLPQYLHLREAWETVERTRSRAFVEQLALTPLLARMSIDTEMPARERQLISRIRAQMQILRLHQGIAATELQARLSAANVVAKTERELAQVWELNALPAEYLELRQGQPVGFSELLRLLTM